MRFIEEPNTGIRKKLFFYEIGKRFITPLR